MKVIGVHSKKSLRDFIYLPERIFRDHPCFVPPIWSDEYKAYSSEGNPILAKSDFELLLVQNDKGKAIGRTIVYIDQTFNLFNHSNIGFFGAFECIDDELAAKMLILAAENWLRSKGVQSIRGPINPTAENWGFVLEGYDRPPVYLSPWNPPYYHAFFTAAGYEKAKDLLVYEADLLDGYQLPKRYEGFQEKYIKRHPGIRIRRLNMHHIKADAKAIWEISNVALADNWGYVPVELPVMEDMLKKLKLIVDPDAVWIAEYKGQAVGFCLGFPDINIIMKRINGHLLPYGWAELIFGAKKLRDYRLFGLAVHPDWQDKALDALMYEQLYNSLAAKKVRMEANYILEDNLRIRHALEKLGMQRIKTYRIYEKMLY